MSKFLTEVHNLFSESEESVAFDINFNPAKIPNAVKSGVLEIPTNGDLILREQIFFSLIDWDLKELEVLREEMAGYVTTLTAQIKDTFTFLSESDVEALLDNTYWTNVDAIKAEGRQVLEASVYENFLENDAAKVLEGMDKISRRSNRINKSDVYRATFFLASRLTPDWEIEDTMNLSRKTFANVLEIMRSEIQGALPEAVESDTEAGEGQEVGKVKPTP